MLRALLSILLLTSTGTAFAHGPGGGVGKGGGEGGDGQGHGRHQKHRHNTQIVLPIVTAAGAIAGGILGAQLKRKGNYDTSARNKINQTTTEALETSAAIDGMLAADAIAPENWVTLKSTMAGSLEDAADDEETEEDFAEPEPIDSSDRSGLRFEDSVAVQSAQFAPTPDRSLASAPIDNSSTASSGSSLKPRANEVVDLKTSGAAVFGIVAPTAAALGSPALHAAAPAVVVPSKPGTPGGSTSRLSSSANATSLDSMARASDAAPANDNKAFILAQALLQKKTSGGSESLKQPAKSAKKSRLPDPLKALANLVFPKKSPRYPAAQVPNSILLSSRATASEPVIASEADEQEAEDLNWTLTFLSLLIFFSGATVIYVWKNRPTKSVLQLMVPGNGEHFCIRPANQPGEYILDIKDARGNLVRSAGMLRPQSVARAAVLPPGLAAQLGAEGSFDRFEFVGEGRFIATEKEEGYQIFPFVLT